MKQEYYIKYLNCYQPHILIMGLMIVGMLLHWEIHWILAITFIFWLIRIYKDNKNKVYIRKEFTEKKISKKEYQEHFKRGKDGI